MVIVVKIYWFIGVGIVYDIVVSDVFGDVLDVVVIVHDGYGAQDGFEVHKCVMLFWLELPLPM